MATKPKRDAVLNIRLPIELKGALQLAATDDHGRSLSGMAVRVMREWLQQSGYLKVSKKKGER